MATLEMLNLGWSRTGTSSFAEAIRILGYKTYHMMGLALNNHNGFSGVANGGAYDFSEIFKGDKSIAACDFPAALYYKQLLAKYPDAKVIMQIRDPESWFRYCDETILLHQPNYVKQPFGLRILHWLNLFPLKGECEMLNCLARDAYDSDMSKENLIRCMIKFNEEGIRSFPPDKLQVFKPVDGWGPLCKYLDKPLPDVPYLHVNDTEEFRRMTSFANVMGHAVAAALVALLIGLGWWSLRSIKK